MRIVSGLTGSNSYTQRFESSCQKIGFVCDGVLEADIMNSNITVSILDSSGKLTIVTPKTPLADLFEIAASNEGFVDVKKIGSRFTIRASVELSNYGSIDLQGGNMQIQLDNCVATTIWNLYGIDSEDLTSVAIEYSPIWVASGQFKEIQLSEKYAICVPAASISELHLNYPNGRTGVFVADELKQIANEVNEIAFLYSGVDAGVTQGSEIVQGGKNWWCIGVKGCSSAKILTTAQATVYVIGDKFLG